MKLIAIGFMSTMRCFLDVPREEAIRRCMEYWDESEPPPEEYIKELDIKDEFGAYDVWE